MTDQEIMQALRVCVTAAPCRECPAESDENCTNTVHTAAADAIERLTAENEALREHVLGMDPSRLRELAEADKAGRCVVLPCKVGDTVYQLRQKTHARGMGISPRIVSSACVWADGSYALTHQGMLYCQDRDLGKTWFLTREEAERAMEGRP